MFELNEILVPVDFSPASIAVFEQAVELVSGEKPVVILLHVVDVEFAEAAERSGLAGRDDAVRRLRDQAERDLEALRERAPAGVEVDCVVSEGIPFYEIARKADEFAVDAIVIGRSGRADRAQSLLFGSTAERVIRGCRRPVIVLPLDG
jgi:nucleotide-binding universal stress UspA family protein